MPPRRGRKLPTYLGNGLQERLAIFMLIVLWVLAFYTYFNVKDIVPIQYTTSGQIKKWGRKITLLFFAPTATIIFVGLTLFMQNLSVFHKSKRETAVAERSDISDLASFISWLRIAVMFDFMLVIAFTYLSDKGLATAYGPWLLPALIAIIVVPVLYFLLQSKRHNAADITENR